METTPPPNPFENSSRCAGCSKVLERDCYMIIESPKAPADVGKTVCPDCAAILIAPPINSRVVINQNMRLALLEFQRIRFADLSRKHRPGFP